MGRGIFCKRLPSTHDPENKDEVLDGCAVFAWPEDTKTVNTLSEKYGLITEAEWESLDGRSPEEVIGEA